MQFFQIFKDNQDNQGKAVALLANQVPYYGAFAAFYVPILGAILLLISSNSGVFGSSRIAYAMSSKNLLPSMFQRVHAKFRTPMISIVAFSAVAVLELIFAALPSLDPGAKALYATSSAAKKASTSSPTSTRSERRRAIRSSSSRSSRCALVDPLSPRKFKIPLNIPMTVRGERVRVSDHRGRRVSRDLRDPDLHAVHASDRPDRRADVAVPGHHLLLHLSRTQRAADVPIARSATGASSRSRFCAAPASWN